jgi:hypothetical protein
MTGYDRIRCLHKRSRLETPELREKRELIHAEDQKFRLETNFRE